MLDNNPQPSDSKLPAFEPVREGLYVARCRAVEVQESAMFKDRDGNPQKQLMFSFDLIQEAIAGSGMGPVTDIQGVEHAPGSRRLSVWGNASVRYYDYKKKAKVVTNSGQILKNLGFNVDSDTGIEESDAIGRYCVLNVKSYEKKDGTPGVKIDSTSPFKGDTATLDALLVNAQKVEDVDYNAA